MKPTVLKKISQAMVFLMLVTMLVPAIAFGATTIQNVKFTNDRVTADVYTDVYNSTYGNVSLNVYGNFGATILINSGNAIPTVSGNTYYATISVPVSASVYNPVYLVGSYNNVASSVYTATYNGVSLSSLSFSPTSYSVAAGSTVSATVYANYSDGSKVNVTANAGLSSSLTGVATVNPITGVVTGVSAGTSVLTAHYGIQTVTANVYVTSSSSDSSPPSSTPSGGGVPASSSTSLSVGSDGKVDATSLQNALTSNTNVTITVTGDSASLPASALTGAKDGAVVTISSPEGTYSLPLSVLKLDDLAKALGVNVADLSIKVSVTKVSGDTATAVNSALTTIGAKTLGDVVDFNVVAISKDGKTVTVNFGSTYVSRSLNLNATADSTTATGVLYDPATGMLTFVPSTFNGRVATLKRNGNSVYTVVSVNKSFTDISSSWAKGDIQLLANKLVIDGMTDTTFAPDNNITRAQFAALVVRALGLSTASGASSFSDVKSSDWYAGAVNTAVKAGLVNGYEDGTFRADKQITREELAALVVRALNYAGVKSNLSANQQASLLSKYADANSIVWAKAEIAAAIDAGIINGVTDSTVAPDKQATRAESATMLKRFLSKAGFIN